MTEIQESDLFPIPGRSIVESAELSLNPSQLIMDG
jgi:hypothetical protein